MQAFDGVQELGAHDEDITDMIKELQPSALTQETAEDTSVLELRVPPILQLRKGRICLVHILAGDRISIADRVLQGADLLAVSSSRMESEARRTLQCSDNTAAVWSPEYDGINKISSRDSATAMFTKYSLSAVSMATFSCWDK